MDSLKKFSRNVNIGYSAIQISLISSVSVWFGYIVVILQTKDFNNSQIGLTMALGSLMSIILPPLIALFYDRHKRIPLKYIVAALLFFGIAGTTAVIFVKAPVALVLIIFSLILTAALTTMPFINALAMQFENIGIPVNYGLARGIGSIGYASFGYLTGLLIDKLGVEILAPFYILLLIITSFFVLIFKRPDHSGILRKKKDAVVQTLKFSSEWKGFYNSKACVFFFLAMICLTLNHGTLDTFQISIIKSVGGTNTDYGILMFVMAISEMPTMFLFKHLAKRFSYAQLMSIAFLAFALKDLVLMLATGTGLVIAAQSLNLLTLGLYVPAMVYYANEIAPKGVEVQAQALFGGMAFGLGRIIGNLLGGIIIDAAGLDYMLVFSGAFVLIGFVLMQLSNRNLKIEKLQTLA